MLQSNVWMEQDDLVIRNTTKPVPYLHYVVSVAIAVLSHSSAIVPNFPPLLESRFAKVNIPFFVLYFGLLEMTNKVFAIEIVRQVVGEQD